MRSKIAKAEINPRPLFRNSLFDSLLYYFQVIFRPDPNYLFWIFLWPPLKLSNTYIRGLRGKVTNQIKKNFKCQQPGQTLAQHKFLFKHIYYIPFIGFKSINKKSTKKNQQKSFKKQTTSIFYKRILNFQ
jgi:hypothetical protein